MLEKMLSYYGFNNLEEFGNSIGVYNKADSLRMLNEMYEEDILWEVE